MDTKETSTSVATAQQSQAEPAPGKEAALAAEQAKVQVQEGTADTASKGAEKDTATQSSTRTYSEDEWRKRESSWDKRYKAERQELDNRLKALENERAALLEQVDTEKERAYLQLVSDKGGDVDAAKLVLQRDREAKRAMAEVKKLQDELGQRMQLVNAAEKVKNARDLIAKYGLDSSLEETLLESESPAEMRAAAAEFALEKTKTTQVTTQVVDKRTSSSAPTVDTKHVPSVSRLGQLANEATASLPPKVKNN